MSDTRFDLIVVGLGAMGSAALYHASARGLRVLGIDRHHPPHELGSSHAETRVTRLAVAEGEQYLPFVARSHEIWRDLETKTGQELLHQPGGYIVNPISPSEDDRWGSFVGRTSRLATDFGIEHELRSHDQVMAHMPAVIIGSDEHAYFEPTGGVVMCERAVELQLSLAKAQGASVICGQAVDRVEPSATGARVSLAGASYDAAKVIVATGAWFSELAPAIDAQAVSVTRQAVMWFEVDDPATFAADRFPFFLWAGHTIEDYSAIFPMPHDGIGALKILGEQFHDNTTAESVDRRVTDSEIDEFYERLVVPRVHGVRRECRKTSVCLYTNTSDDHFLIDHDPASEHVLFASPCSGHGFKHSTAVGEAMVELLIDGESRNDLSPFARHS